MSDLTPTDGGLPGHGPEEVHCAYCGVRLNRRLWFCTNCATPYKDHRSVLPVLRPPELTDEELIASDIKKRKNIWKVPSQFPFSLILVGKTLFAGGTDAVAAFDTK
ncbi:hypothetical protein LCGC14_2383190, partial [marine sediment metagenome]